MSSFNLSIQDYNINELKDLLNLVDPYTLEDIVNNENELREKLLMDPNVSKEKKQGISKFLQTTKAILIKLKKEEFSSMPTDELIGNPNHPVPKRIHNVVEKINAVPRDETVADGVTKNTMHKLLCLDSRFRENYYTTLSTNYTLNLPTTIKNVVSMELSALEFPTSYFQISKSLGNNYLWLRWSDPVRVILGEYLKKSSQTPVFPAPLSAILGDTYTFTNPNLIIPCPQQDWDKTEQATGPVLSGPYPGAGNIPIPISSTSSNFNPEQLWFYIAVPDGNYQREPMMQTLNDQFKIATQPHSALIYLFQQLGAYYIKGPAVAPASSKPTWIPTEHLQQFLHGYVAYPQVTIDEFSLRTVISYVKGNATWNAIPADCNCSGFPDYCTVTNAANIKFAYSDDPNLTVSDLLDRVNDPSCNEWLSLYFNRSSMGGGATPYIGEPITPTSSRYNGGTSEEPDLDLKTDGGVISNYGWVLGYRLGFYQGATAYVSEGCYDAWGIKYIYIIVNDFNKNVNNFCIPSYNESLGRTNVLARVSTNAVASAEFGNGISLTNNVNQDNSLKKRIYFGPVDISRIQLQITDELGRILDLNNMDYSMAVNLICLYD